MGLVTDRPGHEVVAVRVIGRDDGSAEQELWCDLVVVATGRGSRLPVWLEQLGYPRPPRRQLTVGVGYASREVRLAPGALGDDLVALSGPTPARPRGGGLSLVEGGRCLVTLMGMLGDHPPTDPVTFTRWARDLALEDIGRALRDAEPLADPVAHRHPTSVWHRYDSTPMPGGLVAVGDAVCTLNPIYGQGMTVAALQAMELRRQLGTGPLRPRRFQGHAARLAGVAWALSTGGDLAFPEVEGPRTAATRALGRYVGLVQAGAAHDPALGRAFLRVTSLVDPPSALFRPAVVARAARHRGSRPGVPATAPPATVL